MRVRSCIRPLSYSSFCFFKLRHRLYTQSLSYIVLVCQQHFLQKHAPHASSVTVRASAGCGCNLIAVEHADCTALWSTMDSWARSLQVSMGGTDKDNDDRIVSATALETAASVLSSIWLDRMTLKMWTFLTWHFITLLACIFLGYTQFGDLNHLVNKLFGQSYGQSFHVWEVLCYTSCYCCLNLSYDADTLPFCQYSV